MKSVYIIGEIGINHNGDIKIARELIEMCKRCGCDAVKFQKRTIDIVYDEDTLSKPRESPWGTSTRQQKEGLEFGQEEFEDINNFCKQLKIDWFASAWDVPSQEFLEQFDCPHNKVASAMVTHVEFLKSVAKEGKHTFLSTGMSSLEQVDEAVNIFKNCNTEITIMHTVSTYPCEEKDLNLACMASLRDRYGVPVGYSGHEVSPTPSIIAAALGAEAIERHVTLDRSMYGSDQSASLEERGLTTMVNGIRSYENSIGNGDKTITDGEEIVAAKLRYWGAKQ
jgi:N-acetylneuraminate synthase